MFEFFRHFCLSKLFLKFRHPSALLPDALQAMSPLPLFWNVQGCITVHLSRFTLFRCFRIGLFSSSATLIGYHKFFCLSTTFYIFSILFLLVLCCRWCSLTTKLSISPWIRLVNINFQIFYFFSKNIRRIRKNALFEGVSTSFDTFSYRSFFGRVKED